MKTNNIPLIFVFSSIFLTFAVFAYSDDNKPTIKKDGENHILSLPLKMKEALQKSSPSFKTWKQNDYISLITQFYDFTENQAPFAVIGDFNDDTVLDVVMDGHDDMLSLRICILSDGDDYKVIEFDKKKKKLPKEMKFQLPGKETPESGLYHYMTFASKSQGITLTLENQPFELKTDAFREQDFANDSTLRYLKDGKFLRYVTKGSGQ